jgi:hypothetical protein
LKKTHPVGSNSKIALAFDVEVYTLFYDRKIISYSFDQAWKNSPHDTFIKHMNYGTSSILQRHRLTVEFNHIPKDNHTGPVVKVAIFMYIHKFYAVSLTLGYRPCPTL